MAQKVAGLRNQNSGTEARWEKTRRMATPPAEIIQARWHNQRTRALVQRHIQREPSSEGRAAGNGFYPAQALQ